MNHFYITTTLPYVNADPHIGFAMEIVRADVIARMHRSLGHNVIFNTGTDEHGQKIYQKAIAEGLEPQAYCDMYAARFADLKEGLHLSYDHFIRTTNRDHKKAAHYFWQLCEKNGDIYKATYQVKYCVGCELEKTDSELVNEKCPIHPNQELEIIDEENYFFRFSHYQQKLLDLYNNRADFVVPEYRHQEIVNFVENGLKDFSISRIASKMPWGVPVPGDEEQVMYVWFDALINYISTLGWPDDTKTYEAFWPGIQIAGKDNLRQQSAMWQAMLMSAGLPPSKQIYVEGFITVEGQKMSKSTGNVINPLDLLAKYGTDAVRYYLLKEIPSFDDGDFSLSRMNEIYASEMSNELGNLLNRITTLAAKDSHEIPPATTPLPWEKDVFQYIHKYQFHDALELIWRDIRKMNKDTNDFEPWNKSKEDRESFLKKALTDLHRIGTVLTIFIPKTGEKILQATQGPISKSTPLFPKVV